MKNKCSLIFIITGTALILSALFLCIYNVIEDKKSGENAHKMLESLKSEIIVETTEMATKEFFEHFEEKDETKETSVKEIDGEKFIGYLTMPSINLELPVMNDWNYSKLDISPCRYRGEAENKDLIIAAHNYSSHFRNIDGLNSGDLFYFTNADGKIYKYQVISLEQIGGTDINAMINDEDDSWDITLFTCTLDGRNRITVRGIMTEK